MSITRFTTIRLTLDISCQFLNNGFIGTIYKGDVMHTEQRSLKSGFGPQTTAEEIVSGLDLRRL
jgi:hypothetical protein